MPIIIVERGKTMKKLILMLIFIILMIACSESVVGPEDPDPAPSDTVADISVEILSWEQEYNNGQAYPWDNVKVIYTIKNIGNISIKSYIIYWVFDICDTLDMDGSPIKYDKHFEVLDLDEEKIDTLNSGTLNLDIPVVDVWFYIGDIEF